MEQAWVRELSDILDREREILASLAGLAEQKTEVVLKGGVQDLERLLNEERPLLMQMENLEKQRISLLRSAHREGRTLSQVAETLESVQQQQFLALLQSFSGIVRRVKKANDINARLIRSRLEFYREVRGGDELYDNAGAKPSGEQSPGLMNLQG